MIRRKDTLGYIDFMRGKYSIHNTKYILNMFKQMTRVEKARLLVKSFDELWHELWDPTSSSSSDEPLPAVSVEEIKIGRAHV